MNVRAAAARVLVRVIDQGRSLTGALPPGLESVRDQRDRALVQELAYGTLRWYHRLDAILDRLLQKPLRQRDSDVRCLLLAGLYQLDSTGISDHAAVHETVQAARDLGKEWAAGLVNGVLRNYQRQTESIGKDIGMAVEARYAHPAWLIERVQADWPQEWEAILDAGNRRPPLSLRVNRRRLDRAAYLEILHQQGILAHPLLHTTHGIRLESPLPVDALPGFRDGQVSVQDAAAQQCAGLLDLQPGQRVLDACAAPGGKTAHILETASELAALVAIDIEKRRGRMIRDNLSRLGLDATVVIADAAAPDTWWDGRRFDRILLDVPCSASGVIRRHPDIKLLRRPDDIDSLAVRQARLLQTLWPLLSPGGMLLYTTCSILVDENAAQTGRFLSEQPDAAEVDIKAPWGRCCAHGRQILPGEDQMDGFYYACMRKAV